MSSFWNNRISISIFGESHGTSIGVVMDNLPPGEYIDMEKVLQFMARRAPKKDGTTTPRSEKDLPQVQSGMLNNRTTGVPLCAIIQNTDTRSKDYSNLERLPRPGHADYTGAMRYRGFQDVRGGGHFSGRLTAPLCFAGAICGQILERRGIYTGAHIAAIHGVEDDAFSETDVSRADILAVREKPFAVINDAQGEIMQEDIRNAGKGGESLGGLIECAVVYMPAGVGSPMFQGLENTIAQLIFGIPAVKGLEFGAGFQVAEMVGSQNNDPFYIDENGHVKTKTNHHGGILGGISSGMPIILRVAIKPTASIAKPQETVDFRAGTNEILQIHGRHDPCIVPRAVPCVEAAVNLELQSHMMYYTHFLKTHGLEGIEMQDENLMKMSQIATPPLMDTHMANILICCLLDHLKKPVTPTQLYEIAVETEIINYFFYQESITYLQKNGSLQLKQDENGQDWYSLTKVGEECAKELKEYVAKPYRDKIISEAKQYFIREKRREEVKISYLPLKKGYHVQVRYLDLQSDLMDLKLYAPDMKQAKYLGTQIMRNPANFYGKVLEAVFSNKEEVKKQPPQPPKKKK